jgi:hypothetical protein
MRRVLKTSRIEGLKNAAATHARYHRFINIDLDQQKFGDGGRSFDFYRNGARE